MSNLSDLLPAGASAKSITATDSGSGIAINKPVILETAGTVTQVAETTVVAALGSSAEFVALRVYDVCAAYDTVNDKFVIVYRKATALTWNAVVATVSGTTISYGTPVEINATAGDGAAIAYDVSAGKMVVVFHDSVGANYGRSAVGTISGTDISFATIVVFTSTAISSIGGLVYDANAQKVVVLYRNDWPYTGYSQVGTISGTLSWGAVATLSSNSVTVYDHSLTYDSTANKVVTSYRDNDTSDYGYSNVGTVSGTTISFGTPVVFESAITSSAVCSYDPNQDKTVIAYRDHGDSNDGKGIVGTVSGTSISFGTAATFMTGIAESIGITYDLTASKTVIAFRDTLPGTPISYMTSASLSGTTLTFDSNLSMAKDTSQNSCTYDPDNGKVLVAYLDDSDDGSGETGDASMFTTGADITNLTASNFLGIADEAISASASGVIVVQGGTKTGLGNASESANAGTPVQFESGNITYNASVFDSNANKIVAFYDDTANSNYGTAAVGTVSGMTSTWGTPVVFNSANSSYIAAAFDSDANKTVTVYRDAGNSYYGTAIVGTVSGTSISFGTEADFNAASTTNIGIGFDSTANKVVVAFRDDGNSDYGTAVVGTVSGTGISFGAEATFQTNQTSLHHVVYDPDENKTVLAYKHVGNSDYGTSNVCTVTGTSISIGADVIFKGAGADPGGAVYDTAANKVVIAYGISGAANAIVGTVSGTSISYGAEAEMVGTSTSVKSAAFDSSSNKTIVTFVEAVTTFDGWAIAGTVSGTSISFATSLNFTDPNNANNIATAYDSNADRTVFTYKDAATSDGQAVIYTPTTSFVTASSYYVQADGTFATSAGTPSVKAGLAISTTALLLNGDS
jgi:hypothetical protein